MIKGCVQPLNKKLMYERDKGFSFFLGHSMDQYRITVVTGENIVATVFSTHDHL